MFLPRDLPRQPNTVIYAKVINSKDTCISVLFKLGKFCKEIQTTFKVIHSNTKALTIDIDCINITLVSQYGAPDISRMVVR